MLKVEFISGEGRVVISVEVVQILDVNDDILRFDLNVEQDPALPMHIELEI